MSHIDDGKWYWWWCIQAGLHAAALMIDVGIDTAQMICRRWWHSGLANVVAAWIVNVDVSMLTKLAVFGPAVACTCLRGLVVAYSHWWFRMIGSGLRDRLSVAESVFFGVSILSVVIISDAHPFPLSRLFLFIDLHFCWLCVVFASMSPKKS